MARFSRVESRGRGPSASAQEARAVRLLAPVLATMVAVPGCVSIARTVNDPIPYAGTRCIVTRWPIRSGTAGNPAGAMLHLAFNLIAPLDLPLSFVLDTLLLPFTGAYALAGAAQGEDEPAQVGVTQAARRPSGVVLRRAPALVLVDASPAMRQLRLRGDEPRGRARQEASRLLATIREGTPVALMDTAGASPWSGLSPADDETRRLASDWLALDDGATATGLAPAVADLLASGAIEQVVLLTTLTRRTGEEAAPAEVEALLAALAAAWPAGGACTLDVIAVGPLALSGADDAATVRRLATARGGRLAVVDLR